jgi:hypothetical protein
MFKVQISRPTQILMATNVVFALVITGELLLPAEPAAAQVEANNDSSNTLPDFGNTRIDAPSMSQLVDLLERPLFFPDRRMPQPEVKEASPPPPTPLRLKLEGIAIAGGARVAVLRNLNGAGLLQLAEGETYDGWTLDALTSTSAQFSRGAQTNELLLDPGTGR